MRTAILLSTYNGEKYLNDQIHSLQKQTFQEWNLYIRDDGSKDDTIQLIKEAEKKDKRIHYLEDSQSNLKPMKSFMKLLKDVEADYYFFCDQDDYWLPKKLEIMLKEIKKKDNKSPELIYCGLQCVDQDLKPINNDFENLIGKINGKSRFIGNDMPGCVMCFNEKLRNIAVENTKTYNDIVMHDWWLALIAETFGNVSFLNRKLILYRQHEDNSIGAGINGGLIKKILQKNVLKKQENLVKITYLQSRQFYTLFNPLLSKEDKRFLNMYLASSSKNSKYRKEFLKKYSLHGSSLLRSLIYREIFIHKLKDIIKKG